MELTRQQLDEAADLAGLDADAVHTDYSGRSMYGQTCPAVYVDSMADAMAFLVALAAGSSDDDPYEVIELARSTRTDGMGLGVVAYWPNLTLIEEEAA